MDPIRPTGRDLSLKWTNSTYAYQWYPLSGQQPHTASQTEKDAMEWHLFAKTLEVARILRYICPSAYKYAQTEIAKITTRLGIGAQYEGRMSEGQGGVWEVGANGRHYSIERNILKKFRAELMSWVKRNGRFTNLNGDLLDLLDLDDSQTQPARFTFGPVPKKVDGKREDAFRIDTRVRMPALTQMQTALLLATHKAHHDVSAWRKDPEHVPPPPADIVAKSHFAFELSARDELELHFFQVKPFSGFEGHEWTRPELAGWAALQDHFHHTWMDGIIAGDWGKVRRADTEHLWTHVQMNMGPTFCQFLHSCPNENRIDNCGKMYPIQTLPVLLSRYAITP